MGRKKRSRHDEDEGWNSKNLFHVSGTSSASISNISFATLADSIKTVIGLVSNNGKKIRLT